MRFSHGLSVCLVLSFASLSAKAQESNGGLDFYGKSPAADGRGCGADGGLSALKASLAVAMASELGRLDPTRDLVRTERGVGLSSAGEARCGAGCAKTRAILGRQFGGADGAGPRPQTFQEDLSQSLLLHRELAEQDALESAEARASEHRLTRVAGPLRLDPTSCGPHYVFQVDDPSGRPLDRARAASLSRDLCFFGEGQCGDNPVLGFRVTDVSCPAGRTCVAIDPTDGDVSTTSSTCAGSAVTFFDDRYYNDPDLDWWSCSSYCITTGGRLGRVWSFNDTVPASGAWIYCIPVPSPMMIQTEINGVVFSLNAFGGAYEYWNGAWWEHTPVSLHSGCWEGNSDCRWIYRDDGMIVSESDQSLALNAWGGAAENVGIYLTRMCAPDNADCTWSMVDGQFVSDANPALRLAAPWGAYDGSLVQLRSDQSIAWSLY